MSSAKPPLFRAPLAVLGALLMLYLLVPIVAFLVRLPENPPGSTSAPGVGDALWISVYTATISTAVIAVLGIPLGYFLARSTGWISRILGVAVQLPLALPPLISGILLVYLVGPYSPIGQFFHGALTDSVTGIVLAEIFVAAPFLVISARSAFIAVDPATEDVAATLGHHAMSRFLRVSLPGAMTGIRAGLLLAWLRAFGEFGATVVLAYNPHSLPVFIYAQFSEGGVPGTTIPVLFTVVAAVVVLLIVDRRPRSTPRRARGLPPPRPPAIRAGQPLDFRLAHRLGSFTIDVAHRCTGAQLAIIGPSGAGKTMTMRLLAGLATPDAGHVRIGSTDVTGTPAETRGIGYLPQDSTLLPRRRVAEQLTFAVGADAGVAAHWARRLRIDNLADRYPDQLSGGQRRRVALAMALTACPRLLLLDEPFTGLDTPVADELRRTLRGLQIETGMATVLVTHDPTEAALLAGEVLVLVDGRVLQAGSQRAVFAHPASPTAARLLGVRNIATGRVRRDGDGARLDAHGVSVPLDGYRGELDASVSWCIRPEDVRLVTRGGNPAIVRDIVHLGAIDEVTISLAGKGELTLCAPADEISSIGQPCRVELPPQAITLWPADGEGDS